MPAHERNDEKDLTLRKEHLHNETEASRLPVVPTGVEGGGVP